MINVNEFRIGNYCRDSLTGEWLLVDEIQKGENNKHVIGFYVVNRDKIPLPDGWEAKPIPLTPEILDKCGFEKKQELSENDIEYSHKDFDHLNCTFEGVGFVYFYLFSDIDTQINNLHQLQNLYFALTGEELEINL